ncbi:MAG: ATP synthase F1 subunit epsilon [Armatimonadetes bacterium]|nr:ATP synthase F1 subunit epsilon [Armatimonadota bacterium]
MAGSFSLDIVTPERLVYQGEVTSLQAPGLDGYFGVLASRAPLMAALGTGQVKFREQGGEERFVAINGGFCQVLANHVVVLADAAEFAEEIDAVEAQARVEQARQHLLGQILSEEDMRRRRQALDAAATRVKVASQVRR